MQKFEKLYINYNTTLAELGTGLVRGSALNYEELMDAAFPVYEVIADKEKWLYQELMSLVNDTNIDIPFSDSFKASYKNSFVRFELIDSFLSEKRVNYDLDNTLDKVLDHYILKKQSYKIIRIIAELLFHSIKSEMSILIVDKILHSYYSDTDIEDRTILFNLSVYLKENFSTTDRLLFNDRYPDFSSY